MHVHLQDNSIELILRLRISAKKFKYENYFNVIAGIQYCVQFKSAVRKKI